MENLKVSIDASKYDSKRSSLFGSPRAPCHTRNRSRQPVKSNVEIKEEHKCKNCNMLMVQPYLPPCKDRICHYCLNEHHKGVSNRCTQCNMFWQPPYTIYADFDFERELKKEYGQVYLQEKAKIAKKFLLYEDIILELNLPLQELDTNDSDDECEYSTVDKTELIEYDEDTPMGQMQKMFKWNREQQEWAQKVLSDKGKKFKSKKKFNDPFKHLGWTSNFKE